MFVFSAKMNVFFHNNTVYINTRTPQIILELNNIVLRLYLLFSWFLSAYITRGILAGHQQNFKKIFKIHKE